MHPDITDLTFQGKACLYKATTAKQLIQARGFFERALAIDPRSVGALLGMAASDFRMASSLLADDRVACFSAAETKVIEALSIAPNHSSAHMMLGSVFIYTNRAVQGIAECEQALRLDRNEAYAHSSIGLAKYYLGRPAETEGHILDALRLSPHESGAAAWMAVVGVAKIQLGVDAEAAGWLRRSIEANRNFVFGHFGLAAALGLLGALDEAQAAVRAGLALDPNFTIQRVLATRLSDNPTYLAGRNRICEGMRMAGSRRADRRNPKSSRQAYFARFWRPRTGIASRKSQSKVASLNPAPATVDPSKPIPAPSHRAALSARSLVEITFARADKHGTSEFLRGDRATGKCRQGASLRRASKGPPMLHKRRWQPLYRLQPERPFNRIGLSRNDIASIFRGCHDSASLEIHQVPWLQDRSAYRDQTRARRKCVDSAAALARADVRLFSYFRAAGAVSATRVDPLDACGLGQVSVLFLVSCTWT